MGHPHDDHELLGRYRAGDAAAMEEIVRRHVDLVYAAAVRQLPGDPHAAEDVTQAVFVLLCQKAGTLKRGTVLAGWLYNATRNVASNARRVAHRRAHHERRARRPEETMADTGDATAAAWDEIGPVLDDGLAKLADADREAIVLRYLSGMTMTDLAAVAGTTEAAARKRVERALDRLREILAHQGVTADTAVLGAALGGAAGTGIAPAGLAAKVSGAVSATSAATATTTGSAIVAGTMSAKVATAAVVAVAAIGSVSLVVAQRVASKPAATAPVATAPLAPVLRPQSLPEWREEFDRVYRLEDGEVVKRFPPPFIPERTEFGKSVMGGGNVSMQAYPNGPDAMILSWAGQVKGTAATYTVSAPTGPRASFSLGGVLASVVGVDDYEVEGTRPVVTARMPGDWIYDPSAAPAARAAAVAEIAAAELKRPIKITRRRVPREVVVVTGDLKIDLPPGQEAVQVSSKPLNPRSYNSMMKGPATGIFSQLSQTIEQRVVDETGSHGPAWDWTIEVRSEFDQALSRWANPATKAKAVDQVLQRLAPQTGLTFKREVRDVDAWVIE